jgi:hypothetical protein
LPLDNKCEPQERDPGILPHRRYKNFKGAPKDKASHTNHHQAIKNNDKQPIPTIMNGAICVVKNMVLSIMTLFMIE